MHTILLAFEEPSSDLPEERDKWEKFWRYTKSISKTDATIEVLSTNVLLIRTSSTLTSLQECLSHAEGLKYKYAIFPDGIVWRGIDRK